MKLSILLLLITLINASPKPAPTFYLRTIDDKAFFLSDEIKKEKPIVLSFFATWCGPCRKEMPLLDSLSYEYPDIQFYLVNVSNLVQGDIKLKEDPEEVHKMLTGLKIGMPVLMDKYAMTAEKYGATTLPYLVIIDQKGNIIHEKTGFNDESKTEIITILKGIHIEEN